MCLICAPHDMFACVNPCNCGSVRLRWSIVARIWLTDSAAAGAVAVSNSCVINCTVAMCLELGWGVCLVWLLLVGGTGPDAALWAMQMMVVVQFVSNAVLKFRFNYSVRHKCTREQSARERCRFMLCPSGQF